MQVNLEKVANIIETAKSRLFPLEKLDEDEQAIPTLVELVNKAKEEWDEAKVFFDEVTDPMLIDHAIHRMESAEKRYMYLLKLADKEETVNNRIEFM